MRFGVRRAATVSLSAMVQSFGGDMLCEPSGPLSALRVTTAAENAKEQR